MSKVESLGRFEELVLLALSRLRKEAYGMEVRRTLADVTERDISIGAVYTALERLEAKGFVSSRRGDPLPERGGRARRYFRLEAAGVAALQEGRRLHDKAWRGLRPAEVKA